MKTKFLQPILLKAIYSGFFRFILRFFVGVRYTDCSFLKGEKQFVIISNHNSHLDTIGLLASLPSSVLPKVRPVAAEDYWGNTKLKSWFSSYFINTLLVKRNRTAVHSEYDPVKAMADAIDDGYSLILFPEGTRGLPEQMVKLKSGIGRLLAQRPELKYVPVFMTGMGKSMPKGSVVPLPYNAVIHYGEPTLPQSSNHNEIMDEINVKFQSFRNLYGIKEDDDD